MLSSNDAQLARRAAALIRDFARPLEEASDPPARADGDELPVYSLLRAEGTDGRPWYSIRRGDQRVLESRDSSAVVGQLLWQISADTVELAKGYLLIHAGAVVTLAGDGLLILGESGSGKTTLVAALVQEGFGYLSDEAGAIDLDEGLAHPWPRPLGFSQDARSLKRFSSLFASGEDPPADELHVAIARIRPGAIAAPCRVRHVIDHCYRAGAATQVEPLSRATALVRMGSAAPRLRHEGDCGLSVLAGLMRGASAHRLVSGDLDNAVHVVRELVKR